MAGMTQSPLAVRPAGLGRATLKIAGTLAKAVAVQTLSLLLLVLIAVLFLGRRRAR